MRTCKLVTNYKHLIYIAGYIILTQISHQHDLNEHLICYSIHFNDSS